MRYFRRCKLYALFLVYNRTYVLWVKLWVPAIAINFACSPQRTELVLKNYYFSVKRIFQEHWPNSPILRICCSGYSQVLSIVPAMGHNSFSANCLDINIGILKNFHMWIIFCESFFVNLLFEKPYFLISIAVPHPP